MGWDTSMFFPPKGSNIYTLKTIHDYIWNKYCLLWFFSLCLLFATFSGGHAVNPSLVCCLNSHQTWILSAVWNLWNEIAPECFPERCHFTRAPRLHPNPARSDTVSPPHPPDPYKDNHPRVGNKIGYPLNILWTLLQTPHAPFISAIPSTQRTSGTGN